MSFGENVRRLRRDKGLNQGELSTLSGIKTGHISKIENDGTDPSLSTVYKLVRAFNCTPNALLLDTESNSLSEVLYSVFERADQLPDRNKKVIIDMLDHYCIAEGRIADSQRVGFLSSVGFNVGPVKPVISKDIDSESGNAQGS